jgi:hypothetical protein
MGRKLTISAALIVLICFFLPWVQLSCGGSHDTSTGIDLAREGERTLWLIPALMLAIVLFGLGAFRRVQPLEHKLFSVMTLLCGLATIYLMNNQRLKFSDHGGLLEAHFTGWFWLGLLSAIAISVTGIAGILRRSRSPPAAFGSALIQYTGPPYLYDPGTTRNQND